MHFETRFKICIRHIHNYTEYNQIKSIKSLLLSHHQQHVRRGEWKAWSEMKVRSAPWTVQLYVTQTQENIHKYRYEKNEVQFLNKNKKIKKNKMCNKIKCAGQYTEDLINNNKSRNVQTGCTGYT